MILWQRYLSHTFQQPEQPALQQLLWQKLQVQTFMFGKHRYEEKSYTGKKWAGKDLNLQNQEQRTKNNETVF